jgi:hypothetical protein
MPQPDDDRRFPYLGIPMRKPKLSAIMAAFFVCLSIPILLFILIYNYYRHSETMVSILHEDVAKASRASVENVENMISGVARCACWPKRQQPIPISSEPREATTSFSER